MFSCCVLNGIMTTVDNRLPLPDPIYLSLIMFDLPETNDLVSSAYMAASETSLGKFDAFQRRGIKIIAMSEASVSRKAVQPLAKRREIDAVFGMNSRGEKTFQERSQRLPSGKTAAELMKMHRLRTLPLPLKTTANHSSPYIPVARDT